MRRVILPAVLATAIVAGAAVLTTTGSAQTAGGPRTIHFTATQTGGFHPKGRPHPGSVVGFTDTLKGDDGSTGRDVGVCTIATGTSAICHVQFVLSTGQLAFQNAPDGSKKDSPGTVIGGNGAYLGARGSASVTEISKKTTEITVNLTN